MTLAEIGISSPIAVSQFLSICLRVSLCIFQSGCLRVSLSVGCSTAV